MKTFDLILEINNVPENTYYDLLALIGNKAKVKVTEIEKQPPSQDKQSDAVEFSEWKDERFMMVVGGKYVYNNKFPHEWGSYTLTELYKIFKKEKEL